jgi:signal transduction histidine kinase
MQQTEHVMGMAGTERKRAEAVVETLATLRSRGESVAEVAHDARNMVTALGLYCDLLEEPGVLTAPFVHYGTELRLVAAASRRLVEKLVSLDGRVDTRLKTGSDLRLGARPVANLLGGGAVRPRRDAAWEGAAPFEGRLTENRLTRATGSERVAERVQTETRREETPGRWDLMPAAPIENMAAELLASHNLLAALAGPAIAVTVDVEGGAKPVRLTGEDLTRVLVNLVKNAAEAMPAGGAIHLELREQPASAGTADSLVLTVGDNGPGISESTLEEIFLSGYTTRSKGGEPGGSWPASHRGLGLAITRSLVEGAGGRILAVKRAAGACFEIELPVRRNGF